MDRFSEHRGRCLDPDPTDDELRYEIEDEGPEESMNAEYAKNYEPAN